ncbi:MAG: hypothetical protein MZV70_08515 [Desulfobacterales bacterium]|nr:hypothetical protein [Desulfobacterales bacterium]
MLLLIALLFFIVFSERGLADLSLMKKERDRIQDQNQQITQENLDPRRGDRPAEERPQLHRKRGAQGVRHDRAGRDRGEAAAAAGPLRERDHGQRTSTTGRLTLARLFAAQGHWEKAAEIYRRPAASRTRTGTDVRAGAGRGGAPGAGRRPERRRRAGRRSSRSGSTCC